MLETVKYEKIIANFTICKRTFDRYCRRNGFIRGPCGEKQVLKERLWKFRSEWCKPRRFWTVKDQWSKIIFSDESMMKIGDNHRVYVWKRWRWRVQTWPVWWKRKFDKIEVQSHDLGVHHVKRCGYSPLRRWQQYSGKVSGGAREEFEACYFSQRVLFSKMMELQYIPQGLSNPGGKTMPSPSSLGHLSAQTWIRSKIAGLLSKIVFNGRY